MIRYKWFAAIACILVFAGPAYAQPQGNDQQRDRQQQNAQPEQPSSSSTQPLVGGTAVQPKASDQALAQTKIYQPNCGNPKDHDEADLCAQWRVAEAAENTLQLTLAQTAIGALGVLFVVVTLGFTARANKAAAIAAQAAVDAVNAERAWMTINEIGLTPANNINQDGVDKGPGLVGHVSWVNKGRSPALEIRMHRYFRMVGMDDAFPSFDLDPDANSSGVAGPDRPVNANVLAIWGQDAADFRSRVKQIALYSKITYKAVGSPSVLRVSEFSGFIQYHGEVLGANGQLAIVSLVLVAGDKNTAS